MLTGRSTLCALLSNNHCLPASFSWGFSSAHHQSCRQFLPTLHHLASVSAELFTFTVPVIMIIICFVTDTQQWSRNRHTLSCGPHLAYSSGRCCKRFRHVHASLRSPSASRFSSTMLLRYHSKRSTMRQLREVTVSLARTSWSMSASR